MAKQLAWRSLIKFIRKAKAVKHDPIQDKLLDAEGVVMDVDSNFIVLNESSSVDFIEVSSLQVASLQMRGNNAMNRDAFGEAVNCRQTVTMTV